MAAGPILSVGFREESFPCLCLLLEAAPASFPHLQSQQYSIFSSVWLPASLSFNLNFYLFTCFWLCWVFIAARGLPLGAASGGYSVAARWLLTAVTSFVSGHRPQSARAPLVAACGLGTCGLQALGRRLGSCGAWAYLLHGMWDLLGPGVEPVSSALAGGFPTTGPPGESSTSLLPLIRAFLITLYLPEKSRN